MGAINTGKVVVGGLAAGIVLNVLDFVFNGIVLKADFDAVNLARNIDPAIGMQGSTLGTMVGLDFVMAILIVFTYAAIRPRYGAGPRTAVTAGLIIGITSVVVAGFFATSGFFPWSVWVKASLASIFNIVVAALVGGALYKE